MKYFTKKIYDQIYDTDCPWKKFVSQSPESSYNDDEEQGGTNRNKWHAMFEYSSTLKNIPVDVQTADNYVENSSNSAWSTDALVDQILLNHIISASFEYYYKIFAGLEVNEQCFPTDSDSVLRVMVSDFVKDEVLVDLGGADDDGVPDFESELFMSDAINTKGTLVRAISPKVFDRVFHVPCVMDDLWFYSPKVLDCIDSSATTLSTSDIEVIADQKGLEANDDWEFTIGPGDVGPACYRYPEQDERQGDDLNNNLSGGMDFAIIYAKLDRG